MRVVPVLDLKGGVAVHAVRGERHAYAPVKSVLSASADPVELARASVERLGSDACYVADLDAIAGSGDHGAVIRAIAALGLSVWLDAGVATADDARRAVCRGRARVIVGTETCGTRAIWPRSRRRRGPPAGAGPTASSAWTIARASSSAARPPWRGPWRRSWRPRPGRRASGRSSCSISPGSARGPARRRSRPGSFARACRTPRSCWAAGCGTSDDLRALARAGYQAALVGTVLHTGVLGPADLVSAA